MIVSDENKKIINAAIKQAEARTSGEIVPVILSKSDLYPAAHFRLALIVGVLFSIACYYLYDFDDPIILIWSQIPGMITGYALAYIPFFKRLLITKDEMHEEVYQRSLQVFYENRVSMTKDRTGIMLFISLLERRVEVLADCGINEKVGKDHWNELVATLIKKIKKGHLIAGVVDSIETCGAKLTESFPIAADDTNEISDELITD